MTSDFFQKFEFCLVNQKSLLLEVNFIFLDHFRVDLLILLTSCSILVVLEVLENSRNPGWRIQDGRRLRTKRCCDVI